MVTTASTSSGTKNSSATLLQLLSERESDPAITTDEQNQINRIKSGRRNWLLEDDAYTQDLLNEHDARLRAPLEAAEAAEKAKKERSKKRWYAIRATATLAFVAAGGGFLAHQSGLFKGPAPEGYGPEATDITFPETPIGTPPTQYDVVPLAEGTDELSLAKSFDDNLALEFKDGAIVDGPLYADLKKFADDLGYPQAYTKLYETMGNRWLGLGVTDRALLEQNSPLTEEQSANMGKGGIAGLFPESKLAKGSTVYLMGNIDELQTAMELYVQDLRFANPDFDSALTAQSDRLKNFIADLPDNRAKIDALEYRIPVGSSTGDTLISQFAANDATKPLLELMPAIQDGKTVASPLMGLLKDMVETADTQRSIRRLTAEAFEETLIDLNKNTMPNNFTFRSWSHRLSCNLLNAIKAMTPQENGGDMLQDQHDALMTAVSEQHPDAVKNFPRVANILQDVAKKTAENAPVCSYVLTFSSMS